MVNVLAFMRFLGGIFRERVRSSDAVNTIPETVNRAARLLRVSLMVIFGGCRIKFDINHPEIIVPIASRFNALVSLIFSSLVGERGEKAGLLVKQKCMMRNEYAAVRRVARRAKTIPIRFESLERPNSNIRSLE